MSHVQGIGTALSGPAAQTEVDHMGAARRDPIRSLIAAAPATLTDAGVMAFALWTVQYHAAFLFHLAPSTTFKIWLASCLGLGAFVLVRRRRRLPTTPPADERRTDTERGSGLGRSRRWLLVVVAVAVAAAVSAGVDVLPWWTAAVLGAVAAGGAIVLTSRAWLSTPAHTDSATVPSPIQSGYALVVSLLVALSSLFLARNTPDDVFYVGKSVWVAERDSVPLRDFLFTEGVAPPLTSQPPIASIEVLAGALGRTFGIHAASATWYLMLPVLAVLAVLALWRLAHRWAPRRPILAFTVAVGYLYLVAGSDAALGTFHLPRLHEGKGMFVSAVIPLLWVYLTEWFDSGARRKLFLIVALSIVAIGLTSTAVIILPLLIGAAALAMTVVGRWRSAATAIVAVVTYPIGAVIVSRLALGPMTSVTATSQFFDAEGTYRRTLLIGVLGVLGGVALWCGPFLARRGTPALLAAGATVTMTMLLIPGVLEAISAVTGLSAVLWRVPWILALPALVGLLCTVDIPGLRRFGSLALAAALIGTFAIFGTPMWSTKSYVEVHDRPTWKLPQQRQRIVFWMRNLDRPPGLLLAPSTLMRTTPIVTSEVRVVMARNGYLLEYDWESEFSQDRLKLAAFADGTATAPVPELAAAIDRLGVTTICVYSGNSTARATAPTLGFSEFARRKAPGAVRCFRRPG